MKLSNTSQRILLLVFLFASYAGLVAFDDGIVGLTMKNGTKVGCSCHGLLPETRVQVTISGPTMVIAGDSATYSLIITGGPGVNGGTDIAASLGTLYPSYLDTMLRRDEPYPGAGFDLTHRDPKPFDGPLVEFRFKYVAPLAPGVVDTIYGNGNSVDGDLTDMNDRWNFAENFLVTIIDRPLPVELSSFTSVIDRNNVMLCWTTASERNNRSFVIERSNENGNWKSIGEVAGAGNSNSTLIYSFNDNGLNTGRYNYRLRQTDFNGSSELFDLPNTVVIGAPSHFELSQNYPNPFNPSTNISFMNPVNENVVLKVFDVNGRLVSTLLDGELQAGYYNVKFDAGGLSGGIYYYTIKSGSFVETKKMVMIK